MQTAQMVKYLPCKQKNLSLILKLCEKLTVVVPPITPGKVDIGGALGMSLAYLVSAKLKTRNKKDSWYLRIDN